MQCRSLCCVLTIFSAATALAQPSADWKAYTNPDFGFTISYPPGLQLAENAGGYIPVCDDTTLACFAYVGPADQGSNFEGAGIAVSILRDAKTDQQCANLGTEQYPRPATQSEIIHGTRFHVGETADGALSHNAAITAWRTVYQHVCFELKAQIDTFSTGAVDEPIREFNSAGLEKRFAEVVRTFRFIGPVRDGADWKLSRDSGCRGTFEYPATDTVRTLVEYSDGTENSDRITCSRAFTNQGREYALAVKVRLQDDAALDRWLKGSGYPVLEDAHVVGRHGSYIEYAATPFHYVYGHGEIFIFSILGPGHHPIAPGDDPVFRHWVASFKSPN